MASKMANDATLAKYAKLEYSALPKRACVALGRLSAMVANCIRYFETQAVTQSGEESAHMAACAHAAHNFQVYVVEYLGYTGNAPRYHVGDIIRCGRTFYTAMADAKQDAMAQTLKGHCELLILSLKTDAA